MPRWRAPSSRTRRTPTSSRDSERRTGGHITFCPTGLQIRLRADDIEAVVTEVGGGLRSLRAAGRDLIAGFRPDQLRPVYRGAVLAPWPNRVDTFQSGEDVVRLAPGGSHTARWHVRPL